MKRTIMTIAVAAIALSATASQAAAWQVTCRDDPIEEIRSCSLRGQTATAIGLRGKRGAPAEFVTVGFDRFPGTDLVFRVDQNRPIRWRENERIGRSAELIKQMIAGRTMMSRYTKWPTRVPVDGTDTLIGFTVKLEEMRKRLREYAYSNLDIPGERAFWTTFL